MTTYAPRYVDIWPWTAVYSSVGTWARNMTAGGLGLGYWDNNTSSALNDESVWNVALDAGTWTATFIYYRLTNAPIITAYLDSTSLGTVDMYGSAATDTVATITGITVATAGVYAFKVKATSKNGSSSGYRQLWQMLTWTRTGA